MNDITRMIRYQGAIIWDDQILLIRHREHSTGRSYWVIPGGGREIGETEEACVRREMREETSLDVVVERLLRDPGSWDVGMCEDPFTFPLVRQLRSVLGYEMEGSA